MSIVVANRSACLAGMGEALRPLRLEAVVGDEVVWVDAGGVDPRIPGWLCLSAPPGASRGELYGIGLARASRELIAFTDSATAPSKGWRAAAEVALTNGAAVVGGPVLPGAEGWASVAGFLVEYGPHAVPPYTSVGGDVAANNVAYRRSALVQVVAPGTAVWKSEVNASLADRGCPPVVVPAMVVVSTKTYGWRDLGPARFAHGRLYGAQRSRHWSLPRRAMAALACIGLPALALVRLVVAAGAQAELRRRFLGAVPLVALALVAWSAGEARGYLSKSADGRDVF